MKARAHWFEADERRSAAGTRRHARTTEAHH